MSRLKTIVALLLPALWLVALVHCVFEFPTSPLADTCAMPSDAFEKSLSLTEHSHLSECIRNRSRRSEQKLETLPQRAAVFPVAPFYFPCTFSLAKPLQGDAFLLQQRWHFVWRVADSPRKPSLFV